MHFPGNSAFGPSLLRSSAAEASHSCGERTGVSTLKFLEVLSFPRPSPFLLRVGGSAYLQTAVPPADLRWPTSTTCQAPGAGPLTPLANTKGYQEAHIWASWFGLCYDHLFLSLLPSRVVVERLDPGRWEWQGFQSLHVQGSKTCHLHPEVQHKLVMCLNEAGTC